MEVDEYIKREVTKLDNTVLERRADVALVDRLYKDGLLNDDAYQAACNALRPLPDWYPWTRRMLLYLGSALILAGIIFFFAYNWAEMGKFLKFGLIEAGIIGCVAGTFIHGMDKLSSKIMLLCASVLVGVLMAVFGQTYQTGADAYELFTNWAVLILGWVIISKFAALWFVWLVVLNTGMILYWRQVGYPAYSIDYQWLCISLAVVNAVTLSLREFGVLCGLKWLEGRWLRIVLLSAVLVNLSIPVMHLIMDYRFSKSHMLVEILSSIPWVGVMVYCYWLYRRKLKDMNSVALIIFNLCVILLSLLGKIVFDILDWDEFWGLFLFTVIILAVIGKAAYWLKRIAEVMSNES